MSVQVSGPGGHPVAQALAVVERALGDAAGTPTWTLPDAELTALTLAAHANIGRAHALMLDLLAETDRRGAATSLGAPSTAAWLAGAARLRPADAKAAVADARALADQLPRTHDALTAGRITPDQAGVIRRAVGDLPAHARPDAATDAEALLLGEADRLGPVELARLGRRILALVDPDAQDRADQAALARAERAYQRRRLALIPTGEGTTLIRGEVCAEYAARLRAVLDPLAAPAPSTADGPDPRTADQRYADALDQAMRLLLNTADLPTHNGEKPHIVVTVALRTLLTGLGTATLLGTGEHLPAADARRLACDAAIIPAVLGTTSVPLDVGRRHRLVDGPLRTALILRDHGCAFPACARPPNWCDAHHITAWYHGGSTSLPNSVLLRGHHHRLIHHGEWHVRLGPDHLPEFLPPAWQDPDRRPRRNPPPRRQ